MQSYKIIKRTFFLCAVSLVLGCEGFKFISIENKSQENVTVIAKHISDSKADTVLSLAPDSTLLIPTYFGPLSLFNEKIKSQDLVIDSLKIFSKFDTIVANGKTEIFKLLKNKRNIGLIRIDKK